MEYKQGNTYGLYVLWCNGI